MDELEIEVRSLDKGVSVLELRGSLDLSSTAKLSRSLEELAAKGKHRVFIDLAKTTHVSSVGW